MAFPLRGCFLSVPLGTAPKLVVSMRWQQGEAAAAAEAAAIAPAPSTPYAASTHR